MVEHILRVPVGLDNRYLVIVRMNHFNRYLDSQQTVVVLPPVAEHPVSAVTAGPVAVLALGQFVLLQFLLHALFIL